MTHGVMRRKRRREIDQKSGTVSEDDGFAARLPSDVVLDTIFLMCLMDFESTCPFGSPLGKSESELCMVSATGFRSCSWRLRHAINSRPTALSQARSVTNVNDMYIAARTQPPGRLNAISHHVPISIYPSYNSPIVS